MTLHALNLICPHCTKSLMDPYKMIDDKQSIRVKISMAGNDSTIRLSSIYGSYEYICDIETPNGEVANFTCPHCNESFNTGKDCEDCSAQEVELKIAEGGKAVFCSRKGCKNHNVGYADLGSTLNQFYKRHQYGDRTDH